MKTIAARVGLSAALIGYGFVFRALLAIDRVTFKRNR